MVPVERVVKRLRLKFLSHELNLTAFQICRMVQNISFLIFVPLYDLGFNSIRFTLFLLVLGNHLERPDNSVRFLSR